MWQRQFQNLFSICLRKNVVTIEKKNALEARVKLVDRKVTKTLAQRSVVEK